LLGRGEVNVVALESEAGALERLRNGRASAVLVESTVAGYIAKTGAEFDEVGPPAGGGTYGIAVANRDTDLRGALVDALAAVMADGTYRSLLEKWGLTRAALDAPAVNGRRVAPSGGRALVRPRCCA
jgi:polar amino acid transport system substrate-binding protein